jgi:hypothetical protein
MTSQSSHQMAEFLVQHVQGADSAQVAESVATAWRAIEAALAPIIGPRGVAALLHRSLHLSAQVHPWLARPGDGEPASPDVAALKAVLTGQSRAVAAAGGALLLRTFCEALATLIGPSLTDRLLRPVLASSSSAATLQDLAS